MFCLHHNSHFCWVWFECIGPDSQWKRQEKLKLSPCSHSHRACVLLHLPEFSSLVILLYRISFPNAMDAICFVPTGFYYTKATISLTWVTLPCQGGSCASLLTMLPSFWWVEIKSKPQPREVFVSIMFFTTFTSSSTSFSFHGSIY